MDVEDTTGHIEIDGSEFDGSILRKILQHVAVLVQDRHQSANAKLRVFWTLLASISEQMSQESEVDPAIESLMEAFRSTENSVANQNWWPLHSAAACQRTSESDLQIVGRAMIGRHTEAVGKAEVTPFHLAAAVRDPNLDIIRRLRGFSLRSGRVRDSAGNLPLHYAARSSNSVAMMVDLLQDYPEGVTARNVDGQSCAHLLCCNTSPEAPEMLRVVLAADPTVAAIQSSKGQLPLHNLFDLCKHHSPFDAVCVDMALQLIMAYPEGAGVESSDGRSPLLSLCYCSCTGGGGGVRVLEAMLAACPSAIDGRSSQGSTCAHLLCTNSSPDAAEMLRVVLAANPALASTQNNAGNLPLHRTFLHPSFSIKIASYAHQLIAIYPQGCAVVDNDGTSPLLALCKCSSDDRFQILEAMLAACPDAIRVRDVRGCNTLHYAARSLYPEFFIRLHTARPEAISERDGENWTALHHCACINEHDSYNWTALHHCAHDYDNGRSRHLAMLQTVYNLNPLAIREVSNRGETVLSVFIDHHIRSQYWRSVMVTLRFLLRKYPEAASIPNNAGRTPYSRFPRAEAVVRRLLLRAAPVLDPEELRRHNYSARRVALFLFFLGVRRDGELTLFSRLSQTPKGGNIVRAVVSFL